MLTTTAAGRTFDYSYCMGMVAMSGAGFTYPVDFAMTANGVVYVINRGAEGLNQRISKCTVDHEFLGQYGGTGSGDGQFTWPMSIDLDQDEHIYVCDEYLQRISIFDQDGKFLQKWGTPGSGDGELQGPSGLAFDREDNLYIVDSLNHRVQKFTKDGKFLAKWGQHGSGEGEFNTPWGICLDRQGDVYVADWKNSRVQKFSPDGDYLATFAGSASGIGTIHRPSGVAVDSEGDVYVTDWHHHRLQIFAPDGAFITSLVGDAQQLSPWAQEYIEPSLDTIKARRRVNLEPEWRFDRPVAVNVDVEDRVFVLESSRGRIQVYDKVHDFEEAPLNL
jgi:DNA-binding beta-propeller fold protein YncE